MCVCVCVEPGSVACVRDDLLVCVCVCVEPGSVACVRDGLLVCMCVCVCVCVWRLAV